LSGIYPQQFAFYLKEFLSHMFMVFLMSNVGERNPLGKVCFLSKRIFPHMFMVFLMANAF